MVHREPDDGRVEVAGIGRDQAIIALFLTVHEDGAVLRDRHIASRHRNVTLERSEQIDLGILAQRPCVGIEIGELLAGGIDLEVVGIANEREALLVRIGFGRDPGHDRGTVGIVELGSVVIGSDIGTPPGGVVGFAVFFHHLRHALGIEVDVELGDIVLGEHHDALAIGGGKLLEQQAVGLGPAHFHCVVVDDRQGHGLAIDHEDIARTAGVDLFVGLDVFPPIADIVGGEVLTIRPFHAFAQIEGVGGGVFRDVPTFGNAGNDFGAIDTPAHQRLVAVMAHLGNAATAPAILELAAIDADFLGRLDYQRIDRQTIPHGRQLARGNPVGKLRGFGVGRALCGRRILRQCGNRRNCRQGGGGEVARHNGYSRFLDHES